MKKRGSAILWILLIIIIILVVVGIYFFIFNTSKDNEEKSNKLIKKDLSLKNITSQDKKEIGNLFFGYYSPSCSNWEGSYYSFQDCLDGFECMAYEYSENLPNQDVSDLLSVMKKEGTEKGLEYYSKKNPSFGYTINYEINECSNGRYKFYEKNEKVVF
jgi:hypothetical protein